MDAALTNTKRIVFLLAPALLLTAPFHALAQALTVNPTSISFTGVSGTSSQNLNVTASASTNFTASSAEATCAGTNWLQIASGNYTASTSNTAIPVTVSSAGLAGGSTCTGVISLVTSSGTQTVGVSMNVATLAASPTSVTLSTCIQYQPVQVASIDGSNQPFTVAIQYATGNLLGNWLYADVGNNQTLSGPISGTTGSTGVTTITIGLQSTAGFGTSMPTADVLVTPTNNTSAVVDIKVNYGASSGCGGTGNTYITITPPTISLTAGLGGSQSQSVSIQNISSATLTIAYTVSPSNQWLSVAPVSTTIAAGGTGSVNVTANSSTLSSTGSYNGSLTLTSTQGLWPALNIPVSFNVTSGSGTGTNTGTLTVGGSGSNTFTTAVNFVEPNLPGGQCISIQDTTPNVDSYTYQVTSSGGNWLWANYGLSGTETGLIPAGGQACVVISLNNNVANGMASGAYQGSVALTSASGSTATINVNLYVSGGVAPGITVTPGPIYVFPNVAANSSVDQQQSFTVTAASGYSLGTATVSSPPGWFFMSSPAIVGNTETFTVTSNSSGLATGIYGVPITLQSTGTQSGTTTITVALPVGQPGAVTTGGTTTVVAPSSLQFQQQLGNSYWTSLHEAQTVTVTGQQGTQYSATVSYTSGNGWLNIDNLPSGGGTFGTGPVSLSVDLFNGVGGLAASTTPYTATVNITTTSGTFSVPVSLLVTTSNVPVLLANPASATFTSNSGTTPAPQTVSVVGSDNTGSTTSPTISLGTPTSSWITASASGNTMTISVNPVGLNTGIYSGTIPVSSSAYTNAINYPVVMIVNGSTSNTGPLTLNPTTISFANVTAQISQNLIVTASTTTSVIVTAQETSCTSATWLQVATGTYAVTSANTSIQVTATPAGISGGTTCHGVISLATSGGTQTVNVSMTVATATGSGNVTVSPLTMSFPYIQGQSVPAAQTASITNVNSGTASIAFTVATAENSGTLVNWLSTGGVTSASTPYTLSVSVAPGNLPPATYTGTVTITPTGGTAQVINVTMTVSNTAIVSATPTSLSMSYTVGGTSPTGTVNVSGGGSAAGFTATASSSSGWLQVSPTSGTTTNSGTVPLTVSIAASALGALTPAQSPYSGTITVAGTSPATGTTTVTVTLTVTAALPVITSVNNAASGATGAVSPGEIVSIYANAGNPIGPTVPVALSSTTCLSPCTVVPSTLGGVQVIFLPSGIPAALLYVSATQINAVVPYQANSGSLSVEVKYLGQSSNAFPLQSTATAPGIFSATGTGTGAAAAAQYSPSGTYSVNTVSTPALPGYTVVLYLTGEGVVTPLPANGGVTQVSSTPPLTPQPQTAPTVLIDNQPATIAFYGEAPGVVSGVLQINVVVPNIPSSDYGAVKLSVSFGTSSSQAGVTLYVQ